MSALNIMLKARRRMLREFPYFGFRLHQLLLVPSTKTSTMATDGKAIYFNEKWVPEQYAIHGYKFIMTVLAHEIMHVDGFHHLRKGSRDHKLWNEAADYAINYALVREGFDVHDGLYSTDYIGKSAEQVYTILESQRSTEADKPSTGNGGADDDDSGNGAADGDTPDQGDSGSESGSDGDTGDAGDTGTSGDGDGPADPDAPWGEVWEGTNNDGTPMSADQKASVQREITSQIFEAAKAQDKIKGVGNGRGAAVDQIISGVSGDPVPWFEHLKDAFSDYVLTEHTFARPERRLLSQGMILPTQEREPNGELVVSVDTSGSIGQDELDAIAGHVQDIIDEINPIKTVVIYCHHVLCGVEEFDRHEDLTLRIPETGGTAFNPPFNYVAREGLEPCAMIYFTDGWGDVGPDGWHDFSEPDYPVIWATTDRAPDFMGCEPFGEVIRVT